MKPETNNEPHVPREEREISSKNLSFSSQGWLKNGNPPGDPNSAKRCNANSKRTGKPCKQPAMANGKCRLHGGLSTGPKTSEGLAKSIKANWKHGFYATEAKEAKIQMKALLQQVKELSTAIK